MCICLYKLVLIRSYIHSGSFKFPVLLATLEGRLLEHSRNAGVLEGKIIANTEENKAAYDMMRIMSIVHKVVNLLVC